MNTLSPKVLFYYGYSFHSTRKRTVEMQTAELKIFSKHSQLSVKGEPGIRPPYSRVYLIAYEYP